MQRDDIRFGKQVVQLDKLDTGHGLACGARTDEHSHLKGSGERCHALADLPESDNPERLAGQFHLRRLPVAEVRGLTPVATHDRAGMQLNAVSQRQNESKDQLRYRGRTVGRHIRYRYTAGRGGFEVHHIDARRKQTDVFQLRQLGQMFRPDCGLVGQQHPGVLGTLNNRIRLGTLIHRQRSKHRQFLPAQITGVGRMAVQNNNIHKCNSHTPTTMTGYDLIIRQQAASMQNRNGASAEGTVWFHPCIPPGHGQRLSERSVPSLATTTRIRL